MPTKTVFDWAAAKPETTSSGPLRPKTRLATSWAAIQTMASPLK